MKLPYELFIAALANRCRGGLVKFKSGQLGRAVCWGLPTAAMLLLAAPLGGLWVTVAYFVTLVVALWAGMAAVSWHHYWDLGSNGGRAAYKWAMLTLCGLVVTAPAAAVVYYFSSHTLALMFLLSGLTLAPAHYVGWHIPSTIKELEMGPPMAEVIFGIFMGSFIYLYRVIS